MVAVVASRRREGTTPRAAAPAWASVAAWGAGLVTIALGAGAASASALVGSALVVIGAAALAWGAAVLARGRIIAPRTATSGALAGIVASALGVAADPAKVSVLTAAAASVLFIAVAIACGVRLRSARRTEPDAPHIAALLVAAVLVAGVVTPALGATEAARLAPDHGSHGIIDPGHH